MNGKWIKGGTIVTDTEVFAGDLLISGEKIEQIIRAGEEPVDLTQEESVEIIDARGKYVMPGGVDIHTHMDLDVGIARAIDTFYTGTVAAACGGTTTIIDHMAFGPDGCSPWHMVKEYHKLADGEAVVDYGFHGVLQHVNEEVLRDMGDIAREEGITSFKAYMTYGGMLDDRALMQVLEKAREEQILIAVHCENDGIVNHYREKMIEEGRTQAKYHPVSRPAQAEAEAVNRLFYMAEAAGDAPAYVVHLSSKEGLEEVRQAAARGQKHIAAETCPQYLTATDDLYEDPQEGLKAIMAPPLRRKEDNEALWKALADGEIQTVATDHCPFTFAVQKQQGAKDFTKCPSGAPGVEERLTVMFSEGVQKGRISLEKFVDCVSTAPAKIGGVYPQKGSLLPGTDADLILLDPEKEHLLTIGDMHGASDYTLYEGMRVKGQVTMTMLRGKIIAGDGSFIGSKGDGHYLKRGISSAAAQEQDTQ